MHERYEYVENCKERDNTHDATRSHNIIAS